MTGLGHAAEQVRVAGQPPAEAVEPRAYEADVAQPNSLLVHG
jgi:hypothetical protein